MKKFITKIFVFQTFFYKHTRINFQFIPLTPHTRSQIIESIFISSEFSSLNDYTSKLFVGKFLVVKKGIRIDKVFHTNGFLSIVNELLKFECKLQMFVCILLSTRHFKNSYQFKVLLAIFKNIKGSKGFLWKNFSVRYHILSLILFEKICIMTTNFFKGAFTSQSIHVKMKEW